MNGPAKEFLVSDGYVTDDANRLEAARRNEWNDQRLRRLDQLLDEGKSVQEASTILESEMPL